ncbi:glycoside hydrolase [Salegentibacter salinarum]|uniref:Glycoside hydrolase n=1 Tax=Salegentibacter salinarum TaxID=447422 RepID=A0A2N0TSQ6_9FLAO|nr:glycosyl hydrolase [Salegentibacter salinarum]PKD17708.1 glycoside hydrolase [Salegentibacter salinarum]SKB51270.1 hypothetical protein SAMN05660903_01170 [Salegentibacter salinarum]
MFNKLIFLPLLALCLLPTYAQENPNDQLLETTWQKADITTKTWTRWWWMGSAIDKKNVKQNLIELHKAGIGGVEITPIYGVKGEEDNYLDFLSPEYLEILDYTIKTADSLEMGVDMVLGTGWPYGGPQVDQEHAATKLVTRTYEIKKGERLKQKIEPKDERDQTTAKLKYLVAFNEEGKHIDITHKVKKDASINWKSKGQDHKVIAVFTGKTGQQVKRAAPGGEGFTVDHYSHEALNQYIQPFDKAFDKISHKPRSVFNDSYEVYATDFTPDFFEEFQSRRGYNLKTKLHLLLEDNRSEEGNRVKSDYRETISDLLLEDFNIPWTEWANEKGLKTRLQAHGSPGNLIDMYASADIPECETFGSMPFDIPGLRREKEDIREGDADPVMLKFSSSAAHIAGKPLTSSETFTWLRDHFKTALSHAKPEVEELFLNGINHIFLHGTTYSPDRAKWPGWKFYASVNFSPNNTIWQDAPELFTYIENSQSMLQAGEADNETLLYWPIHDVWDNFYKGNLFFQLKIHSLDEWLHDTSFYETTNYLMDNGYATDFISDRFIHRASAEGGKIKLPGGSFKSLIVPASKNMPIETLEKLIELKNNGAHIVFTGLPETAPGYHNYKERTTRIEKIIDENNIEITKLNNLPEDLKTVNVLPEDLVNTGLKFIRRKLGNNKIYFLVNHTSKSIDQYIPLQTTSDEIMLFDPLTGEAGKADSKIENGRTMVRVQIESGESFFIKTGLEKELQAWFYYEPGKESYDITGKWTLSFENGGPEIPETKKIEEMQSWTGLGEKAEAFSGTGIYETTFEKPDVDADNWELNLGDVRESASVYINEEYIGTAWAAPFKLKTGDLLEGINKIKIKVTNLAANRVRDMEIRGEEWKIFHEINMVNKDYEEFDATKWDPMPSGLLDTLTLTPLHKN